VHGDAIDTWALVIQIVETFVEADRDFQMWRRRSTEAPAGSAAGARTGAAKESRNG
jgi:hypothetical protein